MIACSTGTANVFLPATPAPNQSIIVKNLNIIPTITVNGNGFNIGGASTYLVYQSSAIQFWFDSTNTVWRVIAVLQPSAWLPWTPTVTASGSMTVSGLTINDAQWQWVNPNTANFKINLTFTLGGTASSTVIVSTPLPSIAPNTMVAPAWSQSPGEPFTQDPWHNLIAASNGFNLRNLAGTNLTLGAYTIESTGFYRIG